MGVDSIEIGGNFDDMFSSMTAGGNNMETEKDDEGRAQLNVSHTN